MCDDRLRSFAPETSMALNSNKYEPRKFQGDPKQHCQPFKSGKQTPLRQGGGGGSR